MAWFCFTKYGTRNTISTFLIMLSILTRPPAAVHAGETQRGGPRTRIFIVSSYHPEYLWSQDTQAGVSQAFLDYHFLDHERQAEEFVRDDYIESSRAVVKKAWMDTKRKSSKKEIVEATARIVNDIRVFDPDIILLGDDNAANYIGNEFIDTDIPIVFWGVNGTPLKYGLIDSLEKPGHNVSGIYQAGYLRESIEFLQKLVPGIRTMAVLSDDSETGRAKVKDLENLSGAGKLPVNIVATVVTNSYAQWKSEAMRLQPGVDAFFVLNHNTLKDETGRAVDQMEAGLWYLQNIRKPECAHEKQFAQEGLLLVVDDSGFKQGYEAVRYAQQILKEGKSAAHLPPSAPERGPVIVNRARAAALGVSLEDKNFIDEFVENSLAMESPPLPRGQQSRIKPER